MQRTSFSVFAENYINEEREALSNIAPFLKSAFTPTVFKSTGFPTEVYESDAELWKLIDSMHEARYHANLKMLGGLTNYEFELFKEVVHISISFGKILKHPIIPRNSLTRSLLSFRAINSFYEASSTKPSVFEIGPGSGYLALLCHLAGWKYTAMDSTGSLCQFQNSLWNHAGINVKFGDVSAEFSQIPWWKFVDLEIELPNSQIVVANHVIFEMTPLALSYSVQRLKEAGAEYLFSEGMGLSRYPTNIDIIKKTMVLIHNTVSTTKSQQVAVFQFKQSNLGKQSKHKVIYKKLYSMFSNFYHRYYYITAIKYFGIIYRKFFSKKNPLKAQVLDKRLNIPSIDVSEGQVSDWIHSLGFPTLTRDEEVIIYSRHTGHYW